MNILITGIHGFVGSNLVAALKDRHTIFGLDIVSPEKEGVQKTFAWSELDQIPPVEVVIHLAGKAHDTKNTSNAEEYFRINVGLTQQIVQYYEEKAVPKLIYFSSVKAVADVVEGNELTEEAIPNPKTPYGQSKLEAENYLQSSKFKVQSPKSEVRLSEQLSVSKAEERKTQSQSPDMKPETWNLEPATNKRRIESAGSGLRTSDQKIYILRPCMIHGPGNKGNLNLLYQVIQKGIPWPLGAFENQRSMVSIDNLLLVVQQLIERPVEPGIYQVADDEPVSTNELIHQIASSLNRKSRIWKLPKKWITITASIGGIFHLPLNPERLQKLTESYVVSNRKLKQALGVERMPVSATDGLKKTLASFGKKD